MNGDSCAFGSFSRVGDSGISVSWPNARGIGGTCRVGFTVRDAQGRAGEGTVEFDAQGLPGTPSIQQTGYTANSASFTVTLGAQQAHPAVSGVTLSGGGSGSCSAVGSATYQCTADGLSNGQKHQFTAQAVNAVGSSQASTAVTAWAYEAPKAPTVTVTPIPNPQSTDQGSGAVRVAVKGSSDTGQFSLQREGADLGKLDGPTATKDFSGLSVGTATFTAIPITRFDVPNIGGGSGNGTAGSGSGPVIGAPRLTAVSLTSTPGNNASATTVPSAKEIPHADEPVTVRYAIARTFESPDCWSSSNNTGKFTGLDRYRFYKVVACASSDFGRSGPVVSSLVRIGEDPPSPRGQRTYVVARDAAVNAEGTAANYLEAAPSLTPRGDNGTIQYRINGTITTSFELSGDAIPVAEVRECADVNDAETCSAWETLSGTNAPTRVSVSAAQGVCYKISAPQPDLKSLFDISAAARDSASVTLVAPPAADATTAQMKITWTGDFSGLRSVTMNVCTTP